jgi:hypothetical protein
VLRYAVDGRKDWPISTCKGEAFCGADSESALVVKKRVDCALGCSQATGCCLNTKQFHRFYIDKLTCERLWSRDHMISPTTSYAALSERFGDHRELIEGFWAAVS